MLYVNDSHHDAASFERYDATFDQHPVLRHVPGARIAVCSPDVSFCLAVILYCKARGGTVFPLPVDMPLEAARRRAERSGCTHLLFGLSAEAALGTVETLAVDRELSPPLIGLVQTSSGTTGEPKYIARSWSSIDAELDSYLRHFDAERLTPVVACPVNHSYGLICGVMAGLLRGAQPVIVTNPNPKYVLRRLRELSAPLLYAAPALLSAVSMLTHEGEPFFAAMTSGTLLSEGAFASIRAKVHHLCQQYGCSETGCLTVGRDIESANDLGTPLPHVELMAGSDATAPREIVAKIHGQTIHTRDLGYFAAGRLRYLARLDDMINVAGLNVYPSEVEEVVLQLPGLVDAVAFKADGGFGGEQVALQFVADRTLTAAQVRAWCAQRLASHQVPMRIAQVAAIPRLPNGKVSRTALSEASRRRDAEPTSARASS